MKIAKLILGIAVAMLLCVSYLMADGILQPAPFDWLALILTLGTPVVVYFATWTVTNWFPKIPGNIVVSVIVPVLGALAVGITQLASSTAINPLLQLLASLVAVYISQVQIQTKKAGQ